MAGLQREGDRVEGSPQLSTIYRPAHGPICAKRAAHLLRSVLLQSLELLVGIQPHGPGETGMMGGPGPHVMEGSVPSCVTRPAYLALPGVGQDLVLYPGVEDERLHGEGDDLLLEGGALVRAEEQAVVLVAEGGAHEDDLKHTVGREASPWRSGDASTSQGLLELPEAGRGPGTGSPQPPEGTSPADTWLRTSGLQN